MLSQSAHSTHHTRATLNTQAISLVLPLMDGKSLYLRHTFIGLVIWRAYNGIEFNLTNPNRFILARRNATQLQMPAAVFQSAGQSPGGLDAAFNSNKFTDLATEVYVSDA